MSYLIINGDARRLPLSDGVANCVITDPPYGTRVARDGYGRRRIWAGKRHVVGDGSLDTMRLGMAEAFRCLKPDSWAAVCCSPKLHRQSIEACETAGFRHAGEFVWDKMAPGLGGGIRYQHENILLMAKGNPVGRAKLPSVLRFSGRMPCEHAVHPSKKPEALFRCLVRYCSAPNDLVLDPFLGAATCILAGMTLGRRVIGVEIDPRYCAIARRRIERPHAAALRPGREESFPLFDGAEQ
jgi:DNA modification methylase